jgi:hypothetical protein
MTSYAPEVQVNRDPTWYGNMLRFATREEAMDYVLGLQGRWTQVYEVRVVESGDQVNARRYAGKTERLDVRQDNSQREMGDVR